MRPQTRWDCSSARSSTRTVLLLPLVLALAVTALLPTIARAESSSETVYHVPIPKTPGNGKEKNDESAAPKKKHTPPGTTPEADRNSPATTEETDAEAKTEPADEPGSKKKRQNGAAPAGPGNHGNGGDHPGGGASPNPSQDQRPTEPKPTTGAPQIGGDSGSSPVLPILIAIVILATISMGVVIYRERRPTG
jgi:hypothetical protein